MKVARTYPQEFQFSICDWGLGICLFNKRQQFDRYLMVMDTDCTLTDRQPYPKAKICESEKQIYCGPYKDVIGAMYICLFLYLYISYLCIYFTFIYLTFYKKYVYIHIHTYVSYLYIYNLL